MYDMATCAVGTEGVVPTHLVTGSLHVTTMWCSGGQPYTSVRDCQFRPTYTDVHTADTAVFSSLFISKMAWYVHCTDRHTHTHTHREMNKQHTHIVFARKEAGLE